MERCDPPLCVRVLGHEGTCRPTWHGTPLCGHVVRWGVVCARGLGHRDQHKTRRQLDKDVLKQAAFQLRRKEAA